VLVFTRKRDEAITIGDGVEIKILRISRDSVRIGVTAAPAVPVHRREVYDQIRHANAASAADLRKAEALVRRLHDRTGRKAQN
jgi:carbon storage regulator